MKNHKCIIILQGSCIDQSTIFIYQTLIRNNRKTDMDISKFYIKALSVRRKYTCNIEKGLEKTHSYDGPKFLR